MASLVDYEDSDSDPDQDLQSAAPHPHLALYKDQSLIMSSSLSSSSSVSASGCRKRAQPPPAGVRPYVPKRQRVSTAAAQTPETPHTPHTPPPAGARLLSEVSERVRPFLALKPGRVELPRRVQCLLQAHQGPVNTLQWSPVDHLSHLLLSASMDNTCKV